jgi:hypothetical protein
MGGGGGGGGGEDFFVPQSGHITYQCVSKLGEGKRSLSVYKSVGQTVVTTKYVYIKILQCMSARQDWDSPNPSLASECAPPARAGGGGAHSPAGEGLGESQFRRLEKKLSTLPSLWL